MHLHRLKIDNFRNLRDIEIAFSEFAEVDGEPRRLRSHAVIGQNGSGKSNMLEAIVTIFRDLDLNYTCSFDYEIDYSVRNHEVQIVGTKDELPNVTIDGERHEAWELCDFMEDPDTGELKRGHAREYLPSHVFAYYSGKSDRFRGLFVDHLAQYMQFLDDSGRRMEYVPPIDPKSNLLKEAPVFADADLRRLFYFEHPHSRIVLLSVLLASESPLKEILELLSIESVDSVLFTLRRPLRLSDELPEDDIRMGDRRFWYDRTLFSEEFLSKIWDLAIAPIDHSENRQVDFRGRTIDQDLLYLYLKDQDALLELREHIGDSYRMFRFAEGSYVADLLDDVRIFVKRKGIDETLAFEQLSEGELQLLTVLGLIRITRQDECLFLLDEPDTHLNPLWKLHYFEQIDAALKQDEDSVIQGDSQIIIATHDPMMIGGLRKEQVRVLRNQNGMTEVSTPYEHPQGMGVSALLKSDIFGLPSTLDSYTLNLLKERNELIAKKSKQALSPTELERLEYLRRHLDDLGFTREYRDPLFQLFIERMYEARSIPLTDLFDPQELRNREELAKRIVEELVRREKTEELSELARELSIEVKK